MEKSAISNSILIGGGDDGSPAFDSLSISFIKSRRMHHRKKFNWSFAVLVPVAALACNFSNASRKLSTSISSVSEMLADFAGFGFLPLISE